MMSFQQFVCLLFIFMLIYFVCMWGGDFAIMSLWWSEDNLGESFLFLFCEF